MAELPTQPAPRRNNKRGMSKTILFLALCVLIALPFFFGGKMGFSRFLQRGDYNRTANPDSPVRERIVEKIKEKIVYKDPPPPPLPKKFVAKNSKLNVAKILGSDFQLQPKLITEQGGIASAIRKDPDSYRVEVKVHIKVPKPNQTITELQTINKNLPQILPKLPQLVSNGKVSNFYHKLYERKVEVVGGRIRQLTEILSRHNFFDCETILELEDDETKQKATLIQAEMDVVADGSDGDRMPDFDDYIAKSTHYQPFTSYGWKKRTKRPNPLLARWEENLRKYSEEYKVKGLSASRNRYLRDKIGKLKREITELKARSFLIAQEDPFIVVPVSILRYRNHPFAPSVGDYAIVIYKDKAYPAIVGDGGPTMKVGEASLRICKELNPKSSPYYRPVSDLKITYLIFPKSRETFGPPDYEHWRNRCLELVNRIGGLGEGHSLHRWENRIAHLTAEEPEPDAPEPDADAPEPEAQPEPTPQ